MCIRDSGEPLRQTLLADFRQRLSGETDFARRTGQQASQRLYDGGRARAGVTAAQANADAARLAYERDVRVALREVEDALTALSSERQRQASLKEAVADSGKALDQSTRLYARGLSAYLPVLVAQRTVNQARDALALSQWEDCLLYTSRCV